MIPRRLLTRATSLSACACRCHASPATLPVRSAPLRTLVSTSSRWKPAAAQLAEPEPEYEATYSHSPFQSSSPSLPLSGFNGLDMARPLIQLPEPLPTDTPASPSDLRSALYPSTGVIDSLSMIDICLRRPDHIPRGYQIFRQLLQEHEKGLRRLPEATVWGKVAEAAASLGRELTAKDTSKSSIWRRRAQEVVDKWETHHRTRGLNVLAGGHEDGIKVYQGWFAGSVR